MSTDDDEAGALDQQILIRARKRWVTKLDELAAELSAPGLEPVTRSEAVRFAVLSVHGELVLKKKRRS